MAALVRSSSMTMDISVRDIPVMLKQFAKTLSEDLSNRRETLDETIKTLVTKVITRHSSHTEVGALGELLNQFSKINNTSADRAKIVSQMSILSEKMIKSEGGIDPRLVGQTRGTGSTRRSIIELSFSSTSSTSSTSSPVMPSSVKEMPKQEEQAIKIAELTSIVTGQASSIRALKDEVERLREFIEKLISQQNEINDGFTDDIKQLGRALAKKAEVPSV